MLFDGSVIAVILLPNINYLRLPEIMKVTSSNTFLLPCEIRLICQSISQCVLNLFLLSKAAVLPANNDWESQAFMALAKSWHMKTFKFLT